MSTASPLIYVPRLDDLYSHTERFGLPLSLSSWPNFVAHVWAGVGPHRWYVFVALAAATGCGLLLTRQRGAGFYLLGTLGLPLVFSLAAGTGGQPRVYVYLLPFLCISVAVAADELRRRRLIFVPGSTHTVDSSDGVGRPWHLAGAPDGGLFFSAGEGDSSGVYFVDADTEVARQVAVLPGARGLALSNDGRTLYAVAVDDYDVWAFDVQDNGELLNRRAIAELFRGDGRYGRRDLQSAAPMPRRRA